MNKKLTYCFLFFVFCFLGCKEQKSEQSITEISFEKTEHDFKFIKDGDNASVVFNFKNIGENDLIINDVRTSCGCTISELSSDFIKPGGDGFVRVTYDAKRLGRFNKTILVDYNGIPGSFSLKIKGFVRYE